MMKLSIITITYNNLFGLKKTLESIYTQTFCDYEQIIIDGNSTDNTVNFIRQYTQMPSRAQNFTWISEPDKGVYDAQNKGILLAQGEYCFFLNAGDYFINEKVLENVFEKEQNVDIIWGNLVVVDDNERIIRVCKGKKDISFLDIYSSIIKHQASFIKRNLFEKYGLYNNNLKIVADWAFFLKTVGFHNASLLYIDINIAYFENNGISNNSPELCKIERQQVLDFYMPQMMQKDYELLHKYKKIKIIDKSKVARFLFRIITKIFK